MPRADYVPYPTAVPEGPRGVREGVEIRFPEVAFHNSIGEAVAGVGRGMQTLSGATKAVAESFDNLGTNFQKVGDTLWHRAIGLQDVQNETTLTKAQIEYDKFIGDKQIEFGKLEGEAASEGVFKAHLKDIEDKRQDMLKKLPNEAVKHGFERSTASSIGSAGMKLAAHAATETKKAYIAASEARADQIKDKIAKSDDVEETKKLAEDLHGEVVGKQAAAKGWSGEVAAVNLKKQLSDAYVAQAMRIGRVNPTAGRELLQANESNIDKNKFNEAMEHIGNNERIIVSNEIGNKVQEANPEGTLPEKKEEAKKLAEAKSNDPKLIQAAIDDAENKHMKHRREVAQQKDLDKKAIWDTAYGHVSPNGEVPTNERELFAYGGEEVRKIWETAGRLDPAERHRVLEFMKIAAKGDVPQTAATRQRVWELEEMWMHDQGRFRDHNIGAEQIPLEERSKLRQKQIQVIKEGIKLEADPKTAEAIAKIRTSVMLPKDLKPGTQKWAAFSGMVREGLRIIQKEQGYDKPLTEQQIKNLGNEVLEKVHGSGYFENRWGIGEVPWYETAKTVPDNVKEQMQLEFPGITEGGMLEKYQHFKTIIMFNKRKEAESAKPAEKPLPKPPEPKPEEKKPEEKKAAEKPPEKTGPQKPDEKRSELLARKVGEFRSSIMTKKAREREEAARKKD